MESKVEIVKGFTCPACGEKMDAVAYFSTVKGYCSSSGKFIKVSLGSIAEKSLKEEVAPVGNLLDQLRKQRIDIVEMVKAARENGDLSENADYHAAREELSKLNARILKEERKNGQ